MLSGLPRGDYKWSELTFITIGARPQGKPEFRIQSQPCTSLMACQVQVQLPVLQMSKLRFRKGMQPRSYSSFKFSAYLILKHASWATTLPCSPMDCHQSKDSGSWLFFSRGPCCLLQSNPCSESSAEADMVWAGLLPRVGPVSKSYSMHTCHLAAPAASPAQARTGHLAGRGSLERLVRGCWKWGGDRRGDRRRQGEAAGSRRLSVQPWV